MLIHVYWWFSLSHHKKVNPKLLSEKTQEYYRLQKITSYSVCPSLGFVRYSVLELSVKMFHTNLQSSVWKRHVGAHAVGHQHGGRKSMKTSGIHFCYKRQLYHSHEQVSIHINTSHKTSTVQIVKYRRIRHYFEAYVTAFWWHSGLNSKWSILKTAVAIELKTFSKIYIKDV